MKSRASLKLAAGAIAVASVATLLPTATAEENVSALIDGKTSATAAASCYEIKQNDPNSPSGAYWLYTPEMDAPQQFYCDQETDGGGWVMIGRGREGWTESYTGRGNANQMASNPDGTDAFSPIQLPSKTVDALIGDTAVSDLPSGVRFSRPLNANGSSIQNIYAERSTQEDWSWTLSATNHWTNVKIENPSGYGANSTIADSLSNPVFADHYYKRLSLYSSADTGWNLGFILGGALRGTSSADTYHWSKKEGGSAPIAFTQVYLRPELTQADLEFTNIADSGSAASAQRELPNSYSAPWTWRTSEKTHSGIVDEMNTYVQAFAQVGDTVFIGGDFLNLNSKKGETVEQSNIAGFNVDSTELVRSFMPKLNGQVKAMAALPNGKLAVGGNFTEVNGEKVNNLVILDPVTGEIDKTWNWDIVNRTSSGVTQIKTLEVQGDYLYIGGNFTHVKGTTSSVYTFSRNAARYDLKTGSVDWNWHPNFNGTVNGISASEDGQSVHAAGYFTMNQGVEAFKLAALNTVDGKLLTNWDWKMSYSSKASRNAGFQFDVQDAGNTVFTAGTEHMIAQYNKGDYSRVSSSITKSGGDFQDLTLHNGVIYGACHCGNFIYEGGDTYQSPWNQATNTHTVRLVAAYDAVTGDVIPEFAPNISGKSGYGVWGQFVDSKGNLWLGGDINKSLGANGVQPTVGFARFTPRDVTPPATPGNFAVKTEGGKDKLTWSNVGRGVTYQILRNDRVIGVSTTTSFEVEHLDNAKYFVRAADAAGNYSASTAAAEVVKIAHDMPGASPSSEPTEESPVAEPAEAVTEVPAEPTVAPGDEAPVADIFADEPVVAEAE